MRKFIYAILICSFLIVGCEDSDNFVNTPQNVDGLSLLGLVNGRTLVYIQTDTTIDIETFAITVTETNQSVLITGTGDDWIIHRGTDKLINLKVGTSSVIQNGYWKEINGLDSLIYFASPPLIMERSLNSNLEWEFFTPFYRPDTTAMFLPFYYANFGYNAVKEYVGIETIITPAGEFDSYKFDLLLYSTAFGSEPIASVSEYFVPQIGLVKQEIKIGSLSRSLVLANYTD